jgi:hypothetical protein
LSQPSYGIPVTCKDCKHLNHEEPLRCVAFPDGIPVWIRGNANAHLQPIEGDHGIRFEPSDEFLKMLEEAARITPEDIEHARKLVAERSPFLAELLEAEAMPEEELPATSDSQRTISTQEVEKKIARMTLDVTYDGIYRVEGDPRPYLKYSVYAQRPDGQVKWLNSSVHVHNPADLLRLETEFKAGDRIRLTEETDWSDPNLRLTLIGFEKLDDSADADSTRHKIRYQPHEFCILKTRREPATAIRDVVVRKRREPFPSDTRDGCFQYAKFTASDRKMSWL